MTLNPFDQYKGDENRLTHALAVTLERSPSFKAAFIDLCAPRRPLGRTVLVKIQDVMRDDTGQLEAAIPDLVLIDKDGKKGLLFEVKVGSGLSLNQLLGHERQARERVDGIQIVDKYVITGRDDDAEKISNGHLQKTWKHIAWVNIYGIASRLRSNCDWARDFADYIEIVATERAEEGDGQVKMTSFTGIPFKVPRASEAPNFEHAYNPRRAKTHLVALVDSLEENEKLLSELGFSKGRKPKRREKIKASGNVWDYLSPVESKGKHIGSHHFTIGIAAEYASASLTIPNKSNELKKLQRRLASADADMFKDMLKNFLSKFRSLGLEKVGFQPCIVIVQRRYRSQSEVYAVDGELVFDVRTLVGHSKKKIKNIPAIKEQPEWAEFCYNLLKGKNSNLQFQIGVRFLYKHAKGLDRSEAATFFENALRATKGVLDEINA